MNKKVINLINLVNRLTLPKEFPVRDVHYEITLSYNEGKPGWYLAHDGKVWTMEEYLPPSQNGFVTFLLAEKALERVLLNVSRDFIAAQKELPEEHKIMTEDRIQELEIEYLSAEISY